MSGGTQRQSATLRVHGVGLVRVKMMRRGDYQSAEALQGADGSPRGRVRVLGWSLVWRRVMWATRASAPDCSATGLMEL